jgi:hypothetical protein
MIYGFLTSNHPVALTCLSNKPEVEKHKIHYIYFRKQRVWKTSLSIAFIGNQIQYNMPDCSFQSEIDYNLMDTFFFPGSEGVCSKLFNVMKKITLKFNVKEYHLNETFTHEKCSEKIHGGIR